MTTYLDYNATAPLRPEVVEVMKGICSFPANASSVHGYGRQAKKILEDSRKIIAENISSFANEIIFTASGTEANIMALRGFPEHKIWVGSAEHSSVIAQSKNYLPVDGQGIIDLAQLEKTLSETSEPVLISVMLANNETGAVQPISDISALCKKYNALLHCDGVQGLGKIPIDFGLLGCDMITLSAHKCGGPVGAACLVAGQSLPIKPLLTGGGQELGRRAGTENIAAIAGFSKAVETVDFKHMKQLRIWLNSMEDAMKSEGATVFAKDVERLPNTSCVAMSKVSNEVQLMDFDLNGFALSAGSACSSGRIEASHVLRAMNVPDEVAKCAIRVSGGWATKQKDIDDFLSSWQKSYSRLQKQ